MPADRLSIPQYAMALAHVASLRSEDPYRKVGAAALDHEAVALAARTKNADPHGAGIAGLIGRCWSSLSDRGAVSSCF